eukprot:scaffold1239_cov175-Pinguiococcus_pyrenoidosus.AAC.33
MRRSVSEEGRFCGLFWRKLADLRVLSAHHSRNIRRTRSNRLESAGQDGSSAVPTGARAVYERVLRASEPEASMAARGAAENVHRRRGRVQLQSAAGIGPQRQGGSGQRLRGGPGAGLGLGRSAEAAPADCQCARSASRCQRQAELGREFEGTADVEDFAAPSPLALLDDGGWILPVMLLALDQSKGRGADPSLYLKNYAQAEFGKAAELQQQLDILHDKEPLAVLDREITAATFKQKFDEAERLKEKKNLLNRLCPIPLPDAAKCRHVASPHPWAPLLQVPHYGGSEWQEDPPLQQEVGQLRAHGDPAARQGAADPATHVESQGRPHRLRKHHRGRGRRGEVAACGHGGGDPQAGPGART